MKVEKINKVTVTYSWSEFFAFLEKHEAFLKYMRNLEQFRKATSEKSLSEWMETCAPVDWICSAFIWDNTPEGRDFWNVLDSFWLADLREVKKQTKGAETVEWVLLK